MPKDVAYRYRFGLRAETAAACLLRLKGYAILARRLKTPLGEIDILASRGRTLAVVEVKASRERDAAQAALSERQRERLVRAARWYMGTNPRYAGHTLRFDFVTVASLWGLFNLPWPRHQADAWRP